MKKLGGRVAKKQKKDGWQPSVARVDKSAVRRLSRTKGSNYERRVAKKLAAWSGETIRRTPMSGGWAHGGGSFGVSGDLVCDNPKWKISVEAKKREDWDLTDLLTLVRAKDSRSIAAWWSQAVKQCPKDQVPWLIFSKNDAADFLMLRRADFDAYTRGDFTAEWMPHFVVQMELETVVLITLDAFLAKVRPPKGLKNHKRWTQGVWPSPLGKTRKTG